MTAPVVVILTGDEWVLTPLPGETCPPEIEVQVVNTSLTLTRRDIVWRDRDAQIRTSYFYCADAQVAWGRTIMKVLAHQVEPPTVAE